MAWKNIGSNKLIFTLIFIFVFSCGAGLDCGYPGSPAFGRPVPVRESYRPGNTVTFHCVHGYTLKGFHQKTCLDNGTWTGIIPICDQSLHGMDQHAYTRAPYDPAQFGAEKAIDGNRDTCTYTDPMKPRWVRVDLKHNHLVEAVAVTVPKNLYLADPAHFLIYVISVKNSTTSGSATYHKCAEFSGKFSTPTVKLSCATGGFYGRYVHIEDQRNSRAHFGICEIDIFVQKDSYDCGEPDRPSNSYTSNPEAGVVEYRCVYGYQLEGAVRRKCLLDGQWSGTQPLCIEIICPALTLAENGVIQYTGPVRGKLVQGTIANVTCDYGYRSSGLALHCLDTSLWSEGELECQPIDCKVPTIRNDLEKYVLLNGSTTYGSMAFLNCDEVGSQDEQASSIRICREDGLWSPPTIDCIPSDPLKTLGLVEDDENIVPNGVIIGMAVVVFLLLLILILILLFKRKQLSRRQSAESLPSKDTSSSLTVSEIKNGLPYENDAFYASITVEDPKNQLKNETKNKPQSENDNPPMVEKGILSTILFAKRKASSNEKQKSRNGSISSGSSPSFYEEIGLRSSGKKSGKQTKKAVNKENNDIQPVYAQVDMDEKRRSRLAKIVPNHSNKTFLHKTEINDISGSYHSEEAPNYDSEPDLEPVVLRELPPIPDDDDQSSGTYASLSRPPEPPTMTSPSVFMRENAIYAASQMTYETPNQHIMKDNDVYSA